MFGSYMHLRTSTKLLIIIFLYCFMTFLYWFVLPQDIITPALYVIPLFLVSIGLPWRKSWFLVPFSAFLGILKDVNVGEMTQKALIQKNIIVLTVLTILFSIGAQLKKAYDELKITQEELQVLYHKANELVNIDYLTSLGNHRFFQQSLQREIEFAQTYHYSLGIIMLDIDNFKIYNDNNGHQAGDMLLNRISEIIKQNIRKQDIPCRYGGEEFVIIMPGALKQGAQEIGERIRKAIEECDFKGRKKQPGGKVTISGGVACFPDDATTGAKLLKAADDKLYTVKRKNKNSVA